MADNNRAFTPSDVPEKIDDYHGGCRLHRIVPDVAAKGVKSVNIELTFEEALRLSTIQSGILKLNRYNRTSKGGREMGLCLSVKVPTSAISVIETRVRKIDPED
jgi:hypothetical protein